MSTPAHRAVRNEDGFTLVELLVVMAITIPVLLAILMSLDAFTSSSAQQNRQVDANDTARRTIDRTVDALRNASTVRRAAATDLVFSTALPTGQRTTRLCVAPGADAEDPGLLYQSFSTTSTNPAGACGSAEAGWTQALVARVPAATNRTAFTYDGATSSATPATVRSVGLTFHLDSTGAGKTQSTTISASATVRRTAGSYPFTPEDLHATCNANGALLSLDLTAAGTNTAGLGVTYTTSAGVVLGSGPASSPVQIPRGVNQILVRVTDAAGVTSLLKKRVECTA